jgi:hypothetical protein
MNNSRINEISIKLIYNKIIEIRIIISIVRVIEHDSKMLVLSGIFNTRSLDATNYANQDYMRVNYTLIVVYTMLLVTSSQSKNVSCFCLDMAQWRSLIGQSLCNVPSIGQTWVLASIGTVVEMGVLSTFKRLHIESKVNHALVLRVH